MIAHATQIVLHLLRILHTPAIIFSITFCTLYCPRWLERVYDLDLAMGKFHCQRYRGGLETVSGWYGPGTFCAWFLSAVATVLQDTPAGPGRADGPAANLLSEGPDLRPLQQSRRALWRNPNTIGLFIALDLLARILRHDFGASTAAASSVMVWVFALSFTALMTTEPVKKPGRSTSWSVVRDPGQAVCTAMLGVSVYDLAVQHNVTYGGSAIDGTTYYRAITLGAEKDILRCVERRRGLNCNLAFRGTLLVPPVLVCLEGVEL